MATNELPNMKYDFSGLSRGRLRTYNMLVEELEAQQAGAVDLGDDVLELLSAAGVPEDFQPKRRKHKIEL